MWRAVFEGHHDSCILAPLCKKFNVTDLVYLVNAWSDEDAFYYSEAHILQGAKEAQKAFVEGLQQDKSIVECEQSGNFILTLNKRPKWMAIYMPLWDKRIIQSKPVIQRTDGTELWEMACWTKEPLMEILNKLPNEFHIKLKVMQATVLDELFLPHIAPQLTGQQQRAIDLALAHGYYDVPRNIDLATLGKHLNMTKQAVQQHLRLAEKKLIPFLVESAKK